MQSIRTILLSLLAFIVVAGATGVPHVVHLCTTQCVEATTCCDEAETADDGCCSDLITIHQIEVTRGIEVSVPSLSKAMSLVQSMVCDLAVLDVYGDLQSSSTFSLAPYLANLFSYSPPKPEVSPLRL